MTTIHDLRRDAESVAHDEWCEHHDKNWCTGTPLCKRAVLLATLDAVEKHLREMVLQPLDDGWHGPEQGGDISELYDMQAVNFAHGHLAAFLSPEMREDKALPEKWPEGTTHLEPVRIVDGVRYWWVSICSEHAIPESDCIRCQAGEWNRR